MKEAILNKLISNYSIDEIEKCMVYNFLQANRIDYTHSHYISNYISGFEANHELITRISALNHNKLEDIVADMELLIPQEDKKINGAFLLHSISLIILLRILPHRKAQK